MTRLRVGVVGTGFIAGRHLTALAQRDDVEVVAVADVDAERAQVTAGRYGATAVAGPLELVRDHDLDAVWLCVPPGAHGPLEDAAVERGLPFFVEKPLATDLSGAVRIGTAVAESGLLTGVGYHWRSLSVVQQARDALADAQVQLVTGSWLDSTPAAPWWSQRSGSGGQLVEQTTHLVDLVRHLAGEVAGVQALEAHADRPAWPDADVPTASVVLLRLRSGAVGTIASSCVLDRRRAVGLQLVAEGQLVSLSEAALSDHELTAVGAAEHHVRTDEDPIAREDAAFLAALRGEGPSPVTYAEALRTHAVVCAADSSALSGGGVVDVEEFLAAAGG